MVDVDGQEPDEMFVSPPSDDMLKKYLTSLGLCVDCKSKTCHNMYLYDHQDLWDEDKLEAILREAFMEANPGLSADDLQVTIEDIESGYNVDE